MKTSTNIQLDNQHCYVNGLSPINRGKTRDIYPTKDSKHLIIVSTDRISTHNIVHNTMIPAKGIVLTAFTIFWIQKMREMLPESLGFCDHLVAFGQDIEPYLIQEGVVYSEDFFERAIVVKKLVMIPFEFIYRRFLTGSLYKSYQKGSNPYGITLGTNLENMSKFQNVIFTPTEKSENDDPVCCLPVVTNFPDAVSKGLYVFRQIEKILNKSGIELVDSKFEFGIDPDTKELCLADEIGTPDSSRFCHSDSINIGCDPEWADKQIARNYAEKYWKDSGLDNKGPISFPPEIIDQLETTYLSLFHGISGIFLRDFCAQYNSSKVF